MLVLSCGGGVALGMLLARLFLKMSTMVKDIPISILMQFVSTFAVWMIADRIGVSAIITVVCYAMTLARRVPADRDARHRIASFAVWEVSVFVLNVLAFVLIGLQLRAIVNRVDSSEWATYAYCALGVCAAVIVTRIVWWMSHNAIARWKIRLYGANLPRPMMLPTVGSGLIISWSGMRGIVTLAAALALPGDYPYRDLVVFCAFAVVLATRVLQGATLRWLIGRVGIPHDDVVDREIGIARAETARAALRTLESDSSPTSLTLRREYESRLESGGQQSNGSPAADSSSTELQRRVVREQRQALRELRAKDVIGKAAFQAVEGELDILELTADPRVRSL